MEIFIQILLLAVGFVMLVKGADWFVDGVSGIAEKFGIPQLVIGLTIVAMGTSAPEAAVSITAALRGNAGITIGNIVGSNILNILIILGITGVITTVAVSVSTLKYETPYLIFITIVLMVMGITGNSISRIEGIILWVLFLIYLGYLFVMAKKGRSEVDEEQKNEGTVRLIIASILGGVLIIWGSSLTVDSASYIAKTFGMSERFIGLTIVALGTSLPELFTSVTAAIKGKADIAIGNIVGSNIFNILFVIGTSSLIIPVVFESKFVIDTIISALAAVLLIISVLKTKFLRRPWGIVMLVGYALYFVYLIC